MVAGVPWRRWLSERPLGVIATVGPDGDAHAVPVEVVVDGDAVYVWAHRTSRKAQNAQRTGRASLVSYKGQSGVLVRGASEILDASHPDYRRITERFLSKYQRGETYGNDTLIKIAAERVSTFD